MAEAAFHRRSAKGVEIFVRLTPRAGRDAIEGVEPAADGRAHLKARVRAVPEKGKANEALLRLMAKALDLPPSSVTLVAGSTGRTKTLLAEGDAAAIEARLDALA